MGDYLRSRAVPASALIEDHDGDTSLLTALHAARLLGAGGRVVVVTQWFHVPRAMLAMQRAGLHEVSGTWPYYVELRDVYSLLREAVAIPFYAVRPVAALSDVGARPAPAVHRPPPA